MRGDPALVADAIDISGAPIQDPAELFWAFIYNVVGIPLAAFGFLNRDRGRRDGVLQRQRGDQRAHAQALAAGHQTEPCRRSAHPPSQSYTTSISTCARTGRPFLCAGAKRASRKARIADSLNTSGGSASTISISLTGHRPPASAADAPCRHRSRRRAADTRHDFTQGARMHVDITRA